MATDLAFQNLAADSEDTPNYRILPHNIDAEQGLLGALLVDNRTIEKIGDHFRAENFFMPAHQRIYTAVQTLIDRGQTASPVTLKNYFETDDDLKEVGGAEYLADLAASVVNVINVSDYASTIYDLHLRRELITLGEEVVNEAYDHNLDSDAYGAIERAEGRLFSLAESGEVKGGFVTLRDSVLTAIELAEKAYKTEGHVTGITSGLADVDKKLGGFQPSDLLILAGRPSMGKSALAVNWAFNAAKAYADSGGKEGGRVAFFALEM